MTRIHFNSIQIGRVERSSAIFQSEKNTPVDWKSVKKENQGFGTIEGVDNKVKTSHSLVNDSDLLDQS